MLQVAVSNLFARLSRLGASAALMVQAPFCCMGGNLLGCAHACFPFGKEDPVPMYNKAMSPDHSERPCHRSVRGYLGVKHRRQTGASSWGQIADPFSQVPTLLR